MKKKNRIGCKMTIDRSNGASSPSEIETAKGANGENDENLSKKRSLNQCASSINQKCAHGKLAVHRQTEGNWIFRDWREFIWRLSNCSQSICSHRMQIYALVADILSISISSKEFRHCKGIALASLASLVSISKATKKYRQHMLAHAFCGLFCIICGYRSCRSHFSCFILMFPSIISLSLPLGDFYSLKAFAIMAADW